MPGPKRLVLFVEGQGDEKAVPVLVKHLLTENNAWDCLFLDPDPLRVGDVAGIFRRKERNWARYLGTAKKRPNLGAVLLLLDGDVQLTKGEEFCPARVGKELSQMARQEGAGTLFSVASVFALQEYESWLIPGIETSAGRHFPPDAEPQGSGKRVGRPVNCSNARCGQSNDRPLPHLASTGVVPCMRFIDLFAGIGGFHVALRRLGYECVFACEIEPRLKSLYKHNFGIEAAGDIRETAIADIPDHDILCAGFPCQPFSKAGSQKGRQCPRFGSLFDNVVDILQARYPTYLILENVPNLTRHNQRRTWKAMRRRLEEIGYAIEERRLSPHQFGIPQIRERVYIVGSRAGLCDFRWPEPIPRADTSILSALDNKPKEARPISQQVIDCLNVWQEFVQRFPKDEHLPTIPIWSMEFGATYPYQDTTPHAIGERALCWYKGSHGKPLRDLPAAQRMQGLPSHARVTEDNFPEWKIDFIRQNRKIHARNRMWIDRWLPKILPFPSSLQKLEWNCKGGDRDIWKYVIQFRASGVRVKRPTSSPSLIAMTTTQVPIIAWERRFMTARECARLQSLDSLTLPETSTVAFKALGNAINADVVELITRKLLQVGAANKPRECESSPRHGHNHCRF